MMRYWLRAFLSWAIFLVIGLNAVTWAKEAPTSPPVHQEMLPDERVSYTLPAGTALQVLLQTPIDTAVNQSGDPLEAIMTQNLYLYGRLLLSKNVRFNGLISRLDPPFQGRDAVLAVRFSEIILDANHKLPIAAHVRTENKEHLWGGNVTPGTKAMRSTQRIMGIGEYNRTVYGGPRAMGDDIHFDAGEHWTIILEQPLVLVPPLEED
jgi:hypothetical protein